MKKCKACNKNKPEKDFYLLKKDSKIRQNDCKDCDKKRVMAGYTKNRGHFAKYMKERRVLRKTTVINAYGGKCECCEEDKIEFLCIDHINGGGTKERKSGLRGSAFYCYLIKNNFPAGHRVLCHNCNFSIGIYGYCPHKEKLIANSNPNLM